MRRPPIFEMVVGAREVFLGVPLTASKDGTARKARIKEYVIGFALNNAPAGGKVTVQSVSCLPVVLKLQ